MLDHLASVFVPETQERAVTTRFSSGARCKERDVSKHGHDGQAKCTALFGGAVVVIG
ncbi:MAG TPA: hypothetical protein VGZ47_13105 [Gemmataceae bacterium]|nr:hypothetical protein [Gemmataceae bacterium]